MDQTDNRFYRHPTMPSRDFLVRQSTLNAMAFAYPCSLAENGPIPAATRLWGLVHDDFAEGRDFTNRVRSSFRVLVESYGGTVCPSR